MDNMINIDDYLRINLYDAVLVLISTLLIVLIVKKFFWNYVRQYLEQRQAFIQSQLDESKANLQESEKLKTQYEEKMANAGLTEIKTKEDFEKYVEANSSDGKYGYGDAWEKTYVFNSIGTFVNLFGGDYYDWTNPKTQEAVKFMYDMMKKKETPISQLADQYDPMMQKFFDGEYASIFMYVGAIQSFVNSGKYGPDKQHIAPMPTFENKAAYISTWGYVLNSASKNKAAAQKFLKYAASEQGELDYTEMTSRLPARTDVLESDELAAMDLPGLDEIKEYVDNTELLARPMAPQAMEFISEMGSLFQQYVSDELTLDSFCEKAQKAVDTYVVK